MITTKDMAPMNAVEAKTLLEKMFQLNILSSYNMCIRLGDSFIINIEAMFQDKDFHKKLHSKKKETILDTETNELIELPTIKIENQTDDELLKFGLATAVLHSDYGITNGKELFHMANICTALFSSKSNWK